jgi:hypothetical protein
MMKSDQEWFNELGKPNANWNEIIRQIKSEAQEEATQRVIEAYDKALERCFNFRSVLELIAAPKRPDGTFNRDRECCQIMAEEILKENT